MNRTPPPAAAAKPRRNRRRAATAVGGAVTLFAGLFFAVAGPEAGAADPIRCSFTAKIGYSPGVKNLPRPDVSNYTLTVNDGDGTLSGCTGDPDLSGTGGATALGEAANPAITSCAAGTWQNKSGGKQQLTWDLVNQPGNSATTSDFTWSLASLAEQLTQGKGGTGSITSGRYSGASFSFVVASFAPNIGECSDSNGLQKVTVTGIVTIVR